MKRLIIAATLVALGIHSSFSQSGSGRSRRVSLESTEDKTTTSGKEVPVLSPAAAPAVAPTSTPVGKGKMIGSNKLPSLSVSIAFLEPENTVLDAEESAKIRVNVTNTGLGVASKVKLLLTPLTSIPGVTLGAIPAIGDLSPGTSKDVEIPLSASLSVGTGQARYRVEAIEDKGFDLDPPAVIAFQTREFSPPKLIVADYMTEGQNGTNVIRPREIVEITARIQNQGHSIARGANVIVTPGENVYLDNESQSQFSLGDLKPGQYRDVKFACYANNRATSVPIHFALKEARGKHDTTGTLELALNKPQRKAMEFVAEAKLTGKMRIDAAPSLAVDVDVNLPKTRMNNPDGIAVVIGNAEYEKTKKVEYALRDAMSIKRYLIDVCGFREENVVFMNDVSKSDFELYFGTRESYQGKLFNMIKPGASDLFVFYSGHGAPGLKDHKGYFVPVECDPNYVELQGYSIETFYANLSKYGAKNVTVVLDACFSGADLVKNVSPLLLKIESGPFLLSNGVAISSSKSDQVSSWYVEKQHGMFTYFFLKGIHDKTADLDGDGAISIDEIYQYVSDRSNGVPYFARRVNGVEQTPTLQGNPKGKILVTY